MPGRDGRYQPSRGLAQHRCFLGDCPSYADDTVVCPGGFWGFRHGIGLPQSRDETGDRAADETDHWAEIRCQDRPEFVIGIAQEFAGDHVTRVRDLGDDQIGGHLRP